MSEPIRTNAGWVTHGHNLFRGFPLTGVELAKDGLWSLFSLAIGSRRLSPRESSYLDELAAALPAADPRLWPVKMMWLVGCYGSPYAAAATADLTLGTSMVGPGCMPNAACMWQELHAATIAKGRDAAIEAWKDEYLSVPFPWLPGFGAPGRPEDERIAFVEAAAERHGFSEGSHYRLLIDLKEAIEPTPMRVGVNAAFAACMLDLGFTPRQIGLLGEFLLQIPLWASAVDASLLRPSRMAQLSPSDVEYIGPAARRSPRDEAEDG